MPYFRDLILVVACVITGLLSVHCRDNGLACSVTPDPVFNGSFVDCSNMKLTQQDLSKLPFVGVTTLDISYNNIGFLPDYTFDRFKHLKCLMCTRCILDGMGKYSLKGLDTLEVLRLDNNRLDMVKWSNKTQARIPPGVFRYVPMLKRLYIDHNGYYNIEVQGYSTYLDIFEYLPRLTHLSIDGFVNLVIGDEFLNFPSLHSLHIHCQSMRVIRDHSLEGFQNSTVKHFELVDGNLEAAWHHIGLDVFQYLPNISYLRLSQIRLGNQNILLMMKPLSGRYIETIILDSVYTPAFGNFAEKVSDTSVTLKNAVFLRSINVSNFIWLDSGLYSLDYNVLLSDMWQYNLKTGVLETDALTRTSILLLFKIMLMRELETFAYLWSVSRMRNLLIGYDSAKENWMSNGLDVRPMWVDPISNGNTGGYRTSKQYMYGRFEREERDVYFPRDASHVHAPSIKSLDTKTKDLYTWAQDLLREDSSISNVLQLSEGSNSPHLTLRFPPKLKRIIIDGPHYMKLNKIYTIMGSQVVSLSITNGIEEIQCHGSLYGLEAMQSISFEGSRKLDLGLDFLDTFANITHLNLRRTNTEPEFYQTHGKRLIEKLTNLEYLEWAENGLKSLPGDIFVTNKRLKYLGLAKNRFEKIPFSLKFTPNLEVLDLRRNSFVDLSAEERVAIDNHISSVDNFKIQLDDNEFSCNCGDLHFILWLKHRWYLFDNAGDYSCISEGGALSTIGSHTDIRTFWRHCQGRYYLLVSAILACSLVAVYLAMFLGMKKKTEIISGVLRVFIPGFKLKTRRDFTYDVFIGYADQDADFVRSGLLRYLEHKWGLSTFVHQRDLRQDPLEMSDALRDSWRCVLLVTETFLYHYAMAHNVMKVASFFAGPSNPQSLVVLVEENVRHRLPDYVLHVVDEDNIMVVPSLDPVLDYETKEFLRTRLAT